MSSDERLKKIWQMNAQIVHRNWKGEEMTHSQYCEWMGTPSNECCCEHCPENRGFSGKACGQQVCWVTAHCTNREE